MLKNKTFIICLILTILAVGLSILPDLIRLENAPPGTIFPLIHNNPEDYFYYLSLMRQGWEGNWLLTSRATPEQFPPVLVQTFFALLGQLSRITGVNLVWTYFLSRIALGASLLITSFYMAKQLLKKSCYTILACIFIAFGTGFWTTTISNQQLTINNYLSFWTRFDPTLRTTYLPHHLLSTILGSLSIVLLAKALRKKSVKKAIGAGFLGLLSGFVYFATMINILGGIIIAFLIYTVSETVTKFKKKSSVSIVNCQLSIIMYIIYLSLSSISLGYLFYLSRTTFPWSAYDKVGQGFTFSIPFWDYVLALGPLLILVFFSILPVLKSKSFLSIFLLGWVIFPFLGIFVIAKIYPKYGNVYFLEATSYIPIGILSVMGIAKIKSWSAKRFKKVYFIFITLLILYFIPQLILSLRQEAEALPANRYNVYIPNEVMEGINWLSQNSQKESIVMAGGFFGPIIPAFSHNRVVFGHRANTYKPTQKSGEVTLFFSQKKWQTAKNILSKYNVAYVFFSLDTDPPTDKFINFLGLKKVFQNEKVRIYKTF